MAHRRHRFGAAADIVGKGGTSNLMQGVINNSMYIAGGAVGAIAVDWAISKIPVPQVAGILANPWLKFLAFSGLAVYFDRKQPLISKAFYGASFVAGYNIVTGLVAQTGLLSGVAIVPTYNFGDVDVRRTATFSRGMGAYPLPASRTLGAGYPIPAQRRMLAGMGGGFTRG